MITFVPLHEKYAQRVQDLHNHPLVSGVLGLENQTVQDKMNFFQRMNEEEASRITISRIILNEEQQCIGITTLMFIDHEKKSCHLGSWLGVDYWGEGYNEQAKEAILKIAFDELKLDRVFLGARKTNERSIAAQRKLPFITMNVEKAYESEWLFLEEKEKCPSILNVVHSTDFYSHINKPL